MKQQDLINTCVFEQIQGLLFSDLSGPLSIRARAFKLCWCVVPLADCMSTKFQGPTPPMARGMGDQNQYSKC